MSNIEQRTRITKAERPKKIKRALQIQSIFTYLFLCVSLTGWIVSVGSYTMYLRTGALYPETQYILAVALSVMVGSSYRGGTLRQYFRRLPWYASAIPIAILLYGIWHFSMSVGTLNEMPPDVRVVAKFHQMVSGHSLFISGYTFYCFLWSYIILGQFPKKKRA